MPGLLFAQIREKYPEQQNLPAAQFPEEFRRQNPALMVLPQTQFISDKFFIQLGPRIVSLLAKPSAYPGWPTIEAELKWLLERLKTAGFVGETERLGARYVDFFGEDIFNVLRFGLQISGQPVEGIQTDITTFLRRDALSIRLHVTNGAIVATKKGPASGSVLDIDAWFGALDVELFGNGLTRFAEAHHAIKGMFFGLIKPELLSKLNSSYK